MNDRFSSIKRSLGGRASRPTAPQRRRSRREQETQHQRVFLFSMVGCVALIVAILGGGAVYEYVIKPNAVLAEVNGHEIRRREYWQYQSIVLYNQARQYESFATQTTGQQQTQFLQFAAQFDAQREDIWGSTEVSSATINQMIEDRLYMDGAESLGISVTDEEAQVYALNQFALPDAPLLTPQPSPTMIPERAEAATSTANAMATEQSVFMGTPIASPIAGGTPSATPPPLATPVAPAATPGATPVTDDVTDPVATPNLQDSRTAAEAEFGIFEDNVFGEANLSMDEYLELWVVPNAVREKVDYQITSQVPQSGPQIMAEHILVGTQELAQQLSEQATGGADFQALARANSTDVTTAPTGGQLGWFIPAELDPAFAEAALALEPGQISAPVQTPYGWHVIRVVDKDEDRPYTDEQFQLMTEEAIDAWVQGQREAASISTDYDPSPTQTPAAFEPPVGAPTPEPPTPIPGTPGVDSATPVEGATPVVDGATPIPPAATPVSGPGGTPVATPVATPVG